MQRSVNPRYSAPMTTAPVTARAPGGSSDPRPSRERIVGAALVLFEDEGYAATTVDAIATRARVSRRTFFHYFRSKDDVLFPAHDGLVARVGELLAVAEGDPVEVVCRALELVFTSYVEDEPTALRRYRLTRRTAELRERELAWVHRYQLLFARYLDGRLGDRPRDRLAAEVIAAALVACHNHVLRQWLQRGGGGDPLSDLRDGLSYLRESFGHVQRAGHAPRRIVAVFDGDVTDEELLRTVRSAIRGD